MAIDPVNAERRARARIRAGRRCRLADHCHAQATTSRPGHRQGGPKVLDGEDVHAFDLDLCDVCARAYDVVYPPPAPRTKSILFTEDVAALLGITPKSFKALRYRGRMPPEDGTTRGRLWWYRSTIDAWIDARPKSGRKPGPQQRSYPAA